MASSLPDPQPLLVYRYFRESRHADSMLRGAVRLSTLATCRAYEDAEQGDPDEGTQTYLSGTIKGGSNDAEFVEQARRSGISIGPGCSDILIDSCTSRRTVSDAYLLCTTSYRDDKLFSKSFGDYCVEILAPSVVLWHITRVLFSLGQTDRGSCAPVTYRDRVYTGLEVIEHPIFVKPAVPYAPQREFRFAWIPYGPLSGPLDVVVPSISHYCRRVA